MNAATNHTSATISADELRDKFSSKFPKHGYKCGTWHFDAERLTLDYKPNGRWQYEIDLERCATGAQLSDWIFQVLGRCSAQDMFDLLRALNTLLRPQANHCSCGINKRIPDVKKFFADRMEGVQ